MSFVHLHVHSHFSFKDSTIRIEEMARAAQVLSMPAVALTDHDNLCGAVRFYHSAKAAGVKPLIGAEITTREGHLTLLALNSDGYSEICRLITKIKLSERPCNLDDLVSCRNLLILSGCDRSHLISALASGKANSVLDTYREAFGDRYYVELQDHLIPGDSRKVAKLYTLASQKGIPCVATNNAHFLRPRDFMLRDILVAMGENRRVKGLKEQGLPNGEYSFKSSAAMADLFAPYPDAIANTLVIAERCDVCLPDRVCFPQVTVPAGHTDGSYLAELCRKEAERLYPHSQKEAVDRRLSHELQVIDTMGFNSYFLIMWDIVRFAKASSIRCTGRGSAADSLVSYLLGITHVDPIQYNLLFERFLNPERRGMPDIDLDLDANRRDEVIHYIYEKYGKDMVAMVATVNTLGARSAVREIAKALGLTAAQQSAISKHLPHCDADAIDLALTRLPELKGEFIDPLTRKIFHYAEHLAGFPRHLGVHNGGVVISDRPINLFSPLEYAAKGVIVCQHDKDDVEKLGLVKMDLLGLKMLSIITDTVRRLRDRGICCDIDTIPPEDPKSYALLRSTRTIGLFQLESPGMRELLGRLQPSRFEDIIATISLFRPGPMQGEMISPYINRRHGREEWNCMHPSLAPALSDTYGVIIYQEQVLQIAHLLAGFTLGQADLLRRAMTKDRGSGEMAKIRETFLAGAVAKGVDSEVANRVFEKIAGFAAYGFNRAHAASFGWISYQSAYLKAHYPGEFLCSTLDNHPCGFYPPLVIAWEAKRLGIPVLPPDVNHGKWNCTWDGESIRLGLKYVHGLSRSHYDRLRSDRPFSSIDEFELSSGLPERTISTLAPFLVPQHSSLCEQVKAEMQLLDVAVTAHPLSLCPVEYTPSAEVEKFSDGSTITVAGLIIIRQTPPTRSGKRIIFLTLHDPTGLVDVTVFPDIQAQYAKTIYRSQALRITGTIRKTGIAGYSIIARTVQQII